MLKGSNYHWHYDYARLARDSGFHFTDQRFKKMARNNDLARLNVEQIIQDLDVATVEKYIENVVEFGLDNEQLIVLDKYFVKIFQLSQLSLEYLLFCMKYLDNTIVLLKREFFKTKDKNRGLKANCEELKTCVQNMKKTIEELKTSSQCQITCAETMAIFQCSRCPKAFSTKEYLLAHIKRRHELLDASHVTHVPFQSETEKLHLEIKELKERLNNTEKCVFSEVSVIPNVASVNLCNNFINTSTTSATATALTNLQQKFELLKVQVEDELKILQTRQFDQGKYENWFKEFLKKIEESYFRQQFSEVFVSHNKSGNGDNIIMKINSSTQTVETCNENICYTCKNAPQLSLNMHMLQESHKLNALQQQLLNKNDVNLESFEKSIHQQVSSSIEKVENQIQSVWYKLQEAEQQNKLYKNFLCSRKFKMNNESFIRNKNIKKQQKSLVKKKKLSKGQITEFIPTNLKIPTLRKEHTTPNNLRMHGDNKNSSSRVPTTKMNDVPRMVVTSDIINSTSSESNYLRHDSELVTELIPDTKPSYTSTLARRSITSLKEATLKGDVLNGLHKQLESMLQDCLEDLGVSAQWLAVPKCSFLKALDIIIHQAKLARKNYSNYDEIRNDIQKNLEQSILDRINDTTETLKVPEHDNKCTKSLYNPSIEQYSSSNLNLGSLKRNRRFSKLNNINPNVEKHFVDDTQTTFAYENGHLNSSEDVHIGTLVLTSKQTSGSPQHRLAGGGEISNLMTHIDAEINKASSKSVLKSYPSMGSLHKKKVIFNLESEILGNLKYCRNEERFLVKSDQDSSATSIASSVLDDVK